jgi:steroid 5-alpha reductase family enzyme
MEPLDPLSLLITGWVASALLMAALWAVERRVRNAAIVDVGWCYGLVLVVLWYAGSVSGEPVRRWLVAAMVCLYALRLGTHLLVDRVWNKTEDGRYRALRLRWGDQASMRVFWYFQLQAGAIAFFSLPPLVVMQNPHPPFHLWDLAGFLLWIVAATGEAIADRQLAKFRSKPWNRDRVCRVGLWHYSRHPNYFFEWLHWWSYVVMSLAIPTGNWGLTLVGPIAMGVALLKVTGIPWTERQSLATRGEEYAVYQRTTNAFIPWFPRRSE